MSDALVSHTIPRIKDEYRTSRAVSHPVESALNRIFCVFSTHLLIICIPSYKGHFYLFRNSTITISILFI